MTWAVIKYLYKWPVHWHWEFVATMLKYLYNGWEMSALWFIGQAYIFMCKRVYKIHFRLWICYCIVIFYHPLFLADSWNNGKHVLCHFGIKRMQLLFVSYSHILFDCYHMCFHLHVYNFCSDFIMNENNIFHVDSFVLIVVVIYIFSVIYNYYFFTLFFTNQIRWSCTISKLKLFI